MSTYESESEDSSEHDPSIPAPLQSKTSSQVNLQSETALQDVTPPNPPQIDIVESHIAQPTRPDIAPSTRLTGPITLQVGNRRFNTLVETLTGASSFFNVLFSGRWNSNAQKDGSFFIDGDPDLFIHILAYLRRDVLPLFYDKVNGHDHAKYAALLKDADYFQIHRLKAYLQQQGYLLVTTIKYSSEVIIGEEPYDATYGAGDEVEFLRVWQNQTVWFCHECDSFHRIRPASCKATRPRSRTRKQTTGPDDLGLFEEPCLKTVVIRRTPMFDMDAWEG